MTDPKHTRQSSRPSPAPDLSASEADVAGWFAGLERVGAPSFLRTRVLATSTTQSGSRLVRMFPLGAWGLATAALLLLSVGTVATVELTTDLPSAPAVATHAGDAAEPLVIVEDPTLAIFHEIQTFDEVGRAPDELIADWHR